MPMPYDNTPAPDTMPNETMSAPFSGSTTCFNALRICRSVAAAISFSCPAGQSRAAIRAWRFLLDAGWARIATARPADRVRAVRHAIRREQTISAAGYAAFGAGGPT